MSEGLNKVILIGNLGAPPELRQTQGGSVLKLRLACTEKWKDKQTGEPKESTEWVNVSIWGNRAQPLSQMLNKGTKVYVEGSLQTTKSSEGKYFTEVKARQLLLLSGGKQQQQQAPPPQGYQQPPQQYPPPQYPPQGYQQPPPQQYPPPQGPPQGQQGGGFV